jgi:hypothetical protein
MNLNCRAAGSQSSPERRAIAKLKEVAAKRLRGSSAEPRHCLIQCSKESACLISLERASVHEQHKAGLALLASCGP